jgi:hypothetical protein
MNSTTTQSRGRTRDMDEPRSLLRMNESDAASVVKRIKQEAADHPYRTIGVATLAGVVLSSPVGRTLAGWAGMRMGWDILLAILRDRQSAAAKS